MSYNITPESASVDYLRPKMSEMIERVARAIFNTQFNAAMEYIPVHDMSEGQARDIARAAIAAMREPTEAMAKAGYRAGGSAESVPEDFIDGWEAAIDAALSEHPETEASPLNQTTK